MPAEVLAVTFPIEETASSIAHSLLVLAVTEYFVQPHMPAQTLVVMCYFEATASQ